MRGIKGQVVWIFILLPFIVVPLLFFTESYQYFWVKWRLVDWYDVLERNHVFGQMSSELLFSSLLFTSKLLFYYGLVDLMKTMSHMNKGILLKSFSEAVFSDIYSDINDDYSQAYYYSALSPNLQNST